MEKTVLATLKINREELILNDFRRKIIAQWLMKLAIEYLNAEHDTDSLLTLDDY